MKRFAIWLMLLGAMVLMIGPVACERQPADEEGPPAETEDEMETDAEDEGKMPPEEVVEEEDEAEPGTIVEVAVAAGDFGTLITALDAAGLTETLRGEGPYTVFAPTDKAFDALPEGTLPELLANKDELKKVLLYHVLAGDIRAARAKELAGGRVTTLGGAMLPIDHSEGILKVGPARVVDADVEASNGVIHVINRVLLPPEADDEIIEEGEADTGDEHEEEKPVEEEEDTPEEGMDEEGM